ADREKHAPQLCRWKPAEAAVANHRAHLIPAVEILVVDSEGARVREEHLRHSQKARSLRSSPRPERVAQGSPELPLLGEALAEAGLLRAIRIRCNAAGFRLAEGRLDAAADLALDHACHIASSGIRRALSRSAVNKA